MPFALSVSTRKGRRMLCSKCGKQNDPLSDRELAQFRLPDEHVEVIEWIEGGRVVRKTINGYNIPPEMLDPMPTVVYQKLYMTRKEVELKYGWIHRPKA